MLESFKNFLSSKGKVNDKYLPYSYFLLSQHPDKAGGIPETLINDWKAVEEKTIKKYGCVPN